MTTLAETKTLKELSRLQASGFDPVQVLEQSIQRGWAGVFPIKQEVQKAGPPWWSTEQSILAKANEVGVQTRSGESWGDLKARINERLAKTK